MKTEFIEARAEEFELPRYVIQGLPSVVCLATTVQFVGFIDRIKEKIERSGRKVVLYKGKRSVHEGQILGCDAERLEGEEYSDVGAFLYIGDGLFHPKILIIKNSIPVFAYDPFSEKFDKLERHDVEMMKKKVNGAYLKFLTSEKIGILVTVKTGQYYPDARKRLQVLYPDKKFYTFVNETIDFLQMENFKFIESWVNTACPRIGYDDSSSLGRPMINIWDIIERKAAEDEAAVADAAGDADGKE